MPFILRGSTVCPCGWKNGSSSFTRASHQAETSMLADKGGKATLMRVYAVVRLRRWTELCVPSSALSEGKAHRPSTDIQRHADECAR